MQAPAIARGSSSGALLQDFMSRPQTPAVVFKRYGTPKSRPSTNSKSRMRKMKGGYRTTDPTRGFLKDQQRDRRRPSRWISRSPSTPTLSKNMYRQQLPSGTRTETLLLPISSRFQTQRSSPTLVHAIPARPGSRHSSGRLSKQDPNQQGGKNADLHRQDRKARVGELGANLATKSSSVNHQTNLSQAPNILVVHEDDSNERRPKKNLKPSQREQLSQQSRDSIRHPKNTKIKTKVPSYSRPTTSSTARSQAARQQFYQLQMQQLEQIQRLQQLHQEGNIQPMPRPLDPFQQHQQAQWIQSQQEQFIRLHPAQQAELLHMMQFYTQQQESSIQQHLQQLKSEQNDQKEINSEPLQPANQIDKKHSCEQTQSKSESACPDKEVPRNLQKETFNYRNQKLQHSLTNIRSGPNVGSVGIGRALGRTPPPAPPNLTCDPSELTDSQRFERDLMQAELEKYQATEWKRICQGPSAQRSFFGDCEPPFALQFPTTVPLPRTSHMHRFLKVPFQFIQQDKDLADALEEENKIERARRTDDVPTARDNNGFVIPGAKFNPENQHQFLDRNNASFLYGGLPHDEAKFRRMKLEYEKASHHGKQIVEQPGLGYLPGFHPHRKIFRFNLHRGTTPVPPIDAVPNVTKEVRAVARKLENPLDVKFPESANQQYGYTICKFDKEEKSNGQRKGIYFNKIDGRNMSKLTRYAHIYWAHQGHSPFTTKARI